MDLKISTSERNKSELALRFIRSGAGADTYFLGLQQVYARLAINHNSLCRPHFLPISAALVRALWPAAQARIVHTDVMGFPYYLNHVRSICSVYHLFDDLLGCYQRGIVERAYHRLLSHYQDLSLKRADLVIGISKYTCQRLIELKDIRAKLVYPFVDTEFFSPLERSRSVSSDKFILFFAGNLTKRKGADLLPKIMLGLGDKFELRFTSGLRTQDNKWPTKNMIALGNLSRQQLLEEYRNCDAFLSPSRLEGFGYSIAEAMACAKPVIASNCSSIPELVDDGSTGLLCEVGNIEHFIEQIRYLANKLTLAQELGRCGREKILKVCNWHEIDRAHAELLRQVEVC